MVVIVPYVVHEHWSLFVFGRQNVWHLDSTPNHQDKEDDTFALQVILAWEASLSRNVELPHEVLCLPIYQQKGNYECGHLVLNNIKIVCKYLVVGMDELDEAPFLEEIANPTEPTAIQIKIMQSMAKELGMKTKEEHGYKPPYTSYHPRPTAPAPAFKKCTKQPPEMKPVGRPSLRPWC